MAKQIVYVPVLTVLDYNDEFYYEIDGDATSSGTVAFLTEQAAFAALIERFKDSWCKHGETIGDFGDFDDFDHNLTTIPDLKTYLKGHVETDHQLKLIDEIDVNWTIKRLCEEFGDEEFFKWSSQEFICFGYVQRLQVEE